jgi:DNA-binding MarR family transcriptional regulator
MTTHSLPCRFGLHIAEASQRLSQRLDNSLGAIRGISLAEYRLLAALADAPESSASRVDLARAVGLTPSGVTRALKPMEKLGIVSTVKSKRDARLAIAGLTPAGRELLNEASSIVDDTMQALVGRTALSREEMKTVVHALAKLTR